MQIAKVISAVFLILQAVALPDLCHQLCCVLSQDSSILPEAPSAPSHCAKKKTPQAEIGPAHHCRAAQEQLLLSCSCQVRTGETQLTTLGWQEKKWTAAGHAFNRAKLHRLTTEELHATTTRCGSIHSPPRAGFRLSLRI
jgi:hypothetical protein